MKTAEELVKLYGFQPLKGFIRSMKVDCPFGGRTCSAGDCICKRGVYEIRSNLVNADLVWTADIGGYNFLLCEFGINSPLFRWYSISIHETAFFQDKDLKGPKVICEATTSHWDGEYAGRGIPRIPESIRGPMYRTADKVLGDCHVQCDDIVQYLIELADYRTGASATAEKS